MTGEQHISPVITQNDKPKITNEKIIPFYNHILYYTK
jgi:hypothetical protein